MNTYSFLRITFLTLVSLGLTLNQPLSASTVVAEYAKIDKVPSNVRFEPNGKIICRVTQKVTISVYHFAISVNQLGSPKNGWYSTSACGKEQIGWIHQSRIILTGKYHPAP
jgi:hypothetical protein